MKRKDVVSAFEKHLDPVGAVAVHGKIIAKRSYCIYVRSHRALLDKYGLFLGIGESVTWCTTRDAYKYREVEFTKEEIEESFVSSLLAAYRGEEAPELDKWTLMLNTNLCRSESMETVSDVEMDFSIYDY